MLKHKQRSVIEFFHDHRIDEYGSASKPIKNGPINLQNVKMWGFNPMGLSGVTENQGKICEMCSGAINIE